MYTEVSYIHPRVLGILRHFDDTAAVCDALTNTTGINKPTLKVVSFTAKSKRCQTQLKSSCRFCMCAEPFTTRTTFKARTDVHTRTRSTFPGRLTHLELTFRASCCIVVVIVYQV